MVEGTNSVGWSPRVDKQLARLPVHIQKKFFSWVEFVRSMGLRHARQSLGYHDEPLKGKRFGQRSVRLNKAYRAIYVELNDGRVQCIRVIEVNKHEY